LPQPQAGSQRSGKNLNQHLPNPPNEPATTFQLSTPKTPIEQNFVTPASTASTPLPSTLAAIAQTQSPVTRNAENTGASEGGNWISSNPPGHPLGDQFGDPQQQPNSNNATQ
jgi:hypothetical protein